MPMPKHLNGAGLGFFIENYEYLVTGPERKTAIKYFTDIGRCNEAGASYRINNARTLFRTPKLLRGALEYIAYQAPKANSKQKSKAKTLLDSLN